MDDTNLLLGLLFVLVIFQIWVECRKMKKVSKSSRQRIKMKFCKLQKDNEPALRNLFLHTFHFSLGTYKPDKLMDLVLCFKLTSRKVETFFAIAFGIAKAISKKGKVFTPSRIKRLKTIPGISIGINSRGVFCEWLLMTSTYKDSAGFSFQWQHLKQRQYLTFKSSANFSLFLTGDVAALIHPIHFLVLWFFEI